MGVPTALAGFLVAVIGLKHPLLDEIKPLWVKLRSLR
jgi:hypothetical protein